jgi:hypothetical protein
MHTPSHCCNHGFVWSNQQVIRFYHSDLVVCVVNSTGNWLRLRSVQGRSHNSYLNALIMRSTLFTYRLEQFWKKIYHWLSLNHLLLHVFAFTLIELVSTVYIILTKVLKLRLIPHTDNTLRNANTFVEKSKYGFVSTCCIYSIPKLNKYTECDDKVSKQGRISYIENV